MAKHQTILLTLPYLASIRELLYCLRLPPSVPHDTTNHCICTCIPKLRLFTHHPQTKPIPLPFSHTQLHRFHPPDLFFSFTFVISDFPSVPPHSLVFFFSLFYTHDSVQCLFFFYHAYYTRREKREAFDKWWCILILFFSFFFWCSRLLDIDYQLWLVCVFEKTTVSLQHF